MWSLQEYLECYMFTSHSWTEVRYSSWLERYERARVLRLVRPLTRRSVRPLICFLTLHDRSVLFSLFQGGIVAILVTLIALLVIIAVVLILLKRRQEKRKQQEMAEVPQVSKSNLEFDYDNQKKKMLKLVEFVWQLWWNQQFLPVPITEQGTNQKTELSFVQISTEEPRNSAFQGTCGFYALLREMPIYRTKGKSI